MKKRHLGLSLAAVLLLSALASCGEAAEAPLTDEKDTAPAAEETEPVTEETVPTDGLPDTNMNGFTFRLLHSTAEVLSWVNTDLDAEEENGDLINDALFRRNTATEERFNCVLEYSADNPDTNKAKYGKLVSAGDNSYDIIMIVGTSVFSVAEYIADLDNIPHLQFDRAWWNPNASIIYKIGGKQVAAGGNFSLSCVSSANCMLFNKRLYGELGLDESLYDYVRAGKWTTDRLFEVASLAVKDLNGDGAMDGEDRMGITGTGKSFHHGLMIGAGLHYLSMDEDGFPYLSVTGDTKAVGFMEKVVALETGSPYAFASHATNIHSEEYPVDFASGGCLFQMTWPHHMVEYRDMKDNFGVVPMPKYDEAQPQYYSNMANGELITLPRSYEDARLDNIGILLESMSFYSQYNVIPIYKDVLLNSKVTRDVDSSEMLDIVFAGTTYDFGVNIWQDQVGSPICEKIFMKKSDAIVSTLETLSESVNTQIDKLRTVIEEMP